MDPQAKVITVWVAYAIGIVVTGTPFAGVLMAYFCRSTNNQPGFAGHNAAQIRSFWWGLVGWIIAVVIMGIGLYFTLLVTSANAESLVIGGILMIVGFLVGVCVQIAFTIYAIIGIVRASKRKNWPGSDPMMNPEAVFG